MRNIPILVILLIIAGCTSVNGESADAAVPDASRTQISAPFDSGSGGESVCPPEGCPPPDPTPTCHDCCPTCPSPPYCQPQPQFQAKGGGCVLVGNLNPSVSSTLTFTLDGAAPQDKDVTVSSPQDIYISGKAFFDTGVGAGTAFLDGLSGIWTFTGAQIVSANLTLPVGTVINRISLNCKAVTAGGNHIVAQIVRRAFGDVSTAPRTEIQTDPESITGSWVITQALINFPGPVTIQPNFYYTLNIGSGSGATYLADGVRLSVQSP